MKEINSKKALEIVLSKLKRFEEGKVSDEQYSTPSEIASEILWKGYYNKDIEGKVIVDLGSGTGILGIGGLLLGAKKMYFVESDASAVKILEKNLDKVKSEYEIEGEIKIIEDDFEKVLFEADTTIMNPPFGTKKKHADRDFLLKAFDISRVIYSFHKTNTIDYIMQIAKGNNFKISEKFHFNFMLWNTMKHHSRSKKYINVSCLVFRQ